MLKRFRRKSLGHRSLADEQAASPPPMGDSKGFLLDPSFESMKIIQPVGEDLHPSRKRDHGGSSTPNIPLAPPRTGFKQHQQSKTSLLVSSQALRTKRPTHAPRQTRASSLPVVSDFRDDNKDPVWKRRLRTMGKNVDLIQDPSPHVSSNQTYVDVPTVSAHAQSTSNAGTQTIPTASFVNTSSSTNASSSSQQQLPPPHTSHQQKLTTVTSYQKNVSLDTTTSPSPSPTDVNERIEKTQNMMTSAQEAALASCSPVAALFGPDALNVETSTTVTPLGGFRPSLRTAPSRGGDTATDFSLDTRTIYTTSTMTDEDNATISSMTRRLRWQQRRKHLGSFLGPVEEVEEDEYTEAACQVLDATQSLWQEVLRLARFVARQGDSHPDDDAFSTLDGTNLDTTASLSSLHEVLHCSQ